MIDTKGPQWCPLNYIPIKLDHLEPAFPLLGLKSAISNAVLSGEAAVRGKRSSGDYYPSPGAAFERLEKHLSWRANLDFGLSRIIIPSSDPFPASLRDLMSFRSSFSGNFVEVEADLPAVEAWIRENALPSEEATAEARKPFPGSMLPELKIFVRDFGSEATAWTAAQERFDEFVITRDMIRAARKAAGCQGTPGRKPNLAAK